MLTLAVVDDLGTILVIAVFFTDDLSLWWLGAAMVLLLVISSPAEPVSQPGLLRGARGSRMAGGVESGVHATVAVWCSGS